MIDCIATYHQNPLTCGVAKFNRILADRLGIPLLGIFDATVLQYRRPFLSIKCSEFLAHDLVRLHDLVHRFPSDAEIRVFLHDFNDTVTERELVNRASVVYCGNRKIYESLQAHAKLLVKLWSPSTLRPTAIGKSIGELTIFSFGMAHKLRTCHYVKLKRLLDKTGQSYTIFLSTALHDGTSFEEAFAISFEQLFKIFGANIRFLGFLSDDAVIEYLQRSTFFAAFFDHGVRENNSSVIAAMENGCVVITNTDEYSPFFMRHGKTVLDITCLQQLDTGCESLSRISGNAKEVVRNLGWSQLLQELVGEERYWHDQA